jgi:hypothetical protein
MVDEAADAFDGDEPDEHHGARHGGDSEEQRPADGVLPDVDDQLLALIGSWWLLRWGRRTSRVSGRSLPLQSGPTAGSGR